MKESDYQASLEKARQDYPGYFAGFQTENFPVGSYVASETDLNGTTRYYDANGELIRTEPPSNGHTNGRSGQETYESNALTSMVIEP